MTAIFTLLPEAVCTISAESKQVILDRLAKCFAGVYGLDPVLVLERLEEREKLGSTGFGRGVAIPHARIPDLGRPVAVFLRLKTPVAFDAADGLLSAIKYGTVRSDPSNDPFLRALLDVVDISLVISGIGERPAVTHFREFGLRAFTSGSVCVAPRGSMKILGLLKEQRWDEATAIRAAYLPLEDCRDAFSPIRVLHDAVTLADIADMGPMLPMLSNLPATQRDQVAAAAIALKQHDARLA